MYKTFTEVVLELIRFMMNVYILVEKHGKMKLLKIIILIELRERMKADNVYVKRANTSSLSVCQNQVRFKNQN